MPGPRTSEAIALGQEIDKGARKFGLTYDRHLRRHGYSASIENIKRTLTEVAIAAKHGRAIRINLRKPDGRGMQVIFTAETVVILGAMGLGASKVIELIQLAPVTLHDLLTKLGIGVIVGVGALVTTITFRVRDERKQSEKSMREAIAQAAAKIPGDAEALQKSLDKAEHETYKEMANRQIRRALKNAAYRFNNENIELLNEVITGLIEVLATPNDPINIGIEADLQEQGLLSGSIFSNSLKIAGPDSIQNITQEQRLRAILEIIQHRRNSFVGETEI